MLGLGSDASKVCPEYTLDRIMNDDNKDCLKICIELPDLVCQFSY